MDDRDRDFFGRDGSSDQVGGIDNIRAVFGRSYGAEPGRVIEAILTHVAPALGWR